MQEKCGNLSIRGISKKISVLSFKCPGHRKKGDDPTICNGFMAAQLLDSEKGKYLVYCSKCSAFYLATPTDGLYHLEKIDKSRINFISATYLLDGEIINGINT